MQQVNAASTAWERTTYPRFYNKSAEELRKHLGVLDTVEDIQTKVSGKIAIYDKLQKLPLDYDIDITDLPAKFNAIEHWAECDSISSISDQSKCGSCYALAVADSATDRLCIFNQKKKMYSSISNTLTTMKRQYNLLDNISLPSNVGLSPLDIMVCCPDGKCGDKCDGGYLTQSWGYLSTDGIVTGSHYNVHNQACLSYPFKQCGHHTGPEEERCEAMDDVIIPPCTSTCDNESTTTNNFKQDKHFFQQPYSVMGEAEMMIEIYSNGPISAFFNVFEDFFEYKSGVYQWTTGHFRGAHAIRIIGWGIETNEAGEEIKYWLIANSWGKTWGDNGFFKFLRGANHLAIENTSIAALPVPF